MLNRIFAKVADSNNQAECQQKHESNPSSSECRHNKLTSSHQDYRYPGTGLIGGLEDEMRIMGIQHAFARQQGCLGRVRKKEGFHTDHAKT